MHQNQRPRPLEVIERLVLTRYIGAQAVFWGGSIARQSGNEASDLDLVIIHTAIKHAYREAFVAEDWPIDAFIHDPATVRYFFEKSRTTHGIFGLGQMILKGQEITLPNALSVGIKALAKATFDAGPLPWDSDKIALERFFITDILEDITHPESLGEQMASATRLFEMLGQFYFRAQTKWCASGKSLVRALAEDNPTLAQNFVQAFIQVMQRGDTDALGQLVNIILAPYGGLFWEGFRSNAPIIAKIEGNPA